MTGSRQRVRWLLLYLLTGVVFQTGTSCSDLTATAGASLTTSVVNSAIRSSIYQAMGLSVSSGLGQNSLSSLTGAGT